MIERRSLLALVGVSALAFGAPAVAQTAPAVITARSPGGVLAVQVMTDGDGRPMYAVTRLGQPVVTASKLGFILTDAPKLERGFALGTPVIRTADDTWEQPWGERRFIRNHFTELRVPMTERSGLMRRMDVVFRLYDDGLGFRYEFPEQDALKQLKIGSELTEFTLAEDGEAWWIPAWEWNREEYLYNRTPIGAVGAAQTPMTVRNASGLHVSIHEAALIDYSGMNLSRAEGRRFRADLTPGLSSAAVEIAAPCTTPWRTLQISDTAAGLVESSLILNLNAPNKLDDVSWFKPMKYIGIWWEMHLELKSWNSGPKHGATTENAIKHIDFAAEHGFGGVLIEGWNVGWDGNWFGTGWDYSFTQAYPDFDIERVAAYARDKGVEIVGHHETGGNAFHYEQQLDPAFAQMQRFGWHSVKTGYVADAGGAQVRGPDGRVTFAWHESQPMAQHHVRVVETAAKYQVAVNAHEPFKDTGLRRTYPNMISREGARGMEFSAWGQPGNPPEHEANLVFTRLLAGPMDYTPGIFGMETRSPDGIATTWAKQLALYVVIYSPIQMAADLLENYEANPAPFQFIKDVPVDWADTRVLNGEIGDYVTIARKDRNSDVWCLGSLTDEHPRVLSASLSFLDPGRTYRAEIYRDAPDADWKTNREAIVIESRDVTAADTLTLTLAPGGGQAIRFVPKGRRR
ncbi:glycoside hydrolase family 97 protein [Brevundimonas vitis]|uniref:Glycoside hydrolase family 97 protein n=1 Tax=Brevundimonas vitisensis TaxID=2800818 RepID=A0ABX7BPY5_9CAUL|nr:glycoside hydrolase family 97 protein [Brevundimonas vitisensis]QQQ18194.1 glycoside hydrolase family 97 protein [Brevundimonas vitisensis]